MNRDKPTQFNICPSPPLPYGKQGLSTTDKLTARYITYRTLPHNHRLTVYFKLLSLAYSGVAPPGKKTNKVRPLPRIISTFSNWKKSDDLRPWQQNWQRRRASRPSINRSKMRNCQPQWSHRWFGGVPWSRQSHMPTTQCFVIGTDCFCERYALLFCRCNKTIQEL